MNKNESSQLSQIEDFKSRKQRATIARIREAVKHLKRENLPITVIGVVRLTGMSKATIYRYRDFVGKENIRSYDKFEEFFLGID
jgi:hypothetical protein